MAQNVLIMGASDKSDRYSYKAMKMLKEYGHSVFLQNPGKKEIEGQKVFKNLEELIDSRQVIETVTMYVNPGISNNFAEGLIKLAPKRLIFNPGAENKELQGKLVGKGIEVLNACTLVLLRMEQF